MAPAGGIRLTTDALIRVTGLNDERNPDAAQHHVEDLPAETLVYLLGSRYCETDRLSDIAWSLFGNFPTGWSRVQAICAFVHQHLRFDYQLASSTRSAWDGYNERVGVCRDFAHLALTFTRCLNIPARYCTGYMGDIGIPPDGMPMDFSGWFEAYLGGRWYTFDARHNRPRIGRVPIAYGRDCRRCRHQQHLRPQPPDRLPGLDRRSARRRAGGGANGSARAELRGMSGRKPHGVEAAVAPAGLHDWLCMRI